VGDRKVLLSAAVEIFCNVSILLSQGVHIPKFSVVLYAVVSIYIYVKLRNHDKGRHNSKNGQVVEVFNLSNSMRPSFTSLRQFPVARR